MSRGGLKLAAALEHWKIDVQGRACLDVGASTGGFTDCLLQHGAAHVTAVDTGFGQIAMKLRNDPRVRLVERTNARLLEPGALAAGAAGPELTLLVMDVSVHLRHAAAGAGAGGRARAAARPSSWSSRSSRPAAAMWARAASSAIPRRTGWRSTRWPTVFGRWAGRWSRPFRRRLPAWKATRSFCCTRGAARMPPRRLTAALTRPRCPTSALRSVTLGPHDSRRDCLQAAEGRAGPAFAGADCLAAPARL